MLPRKLPLGLEEDILIRLPLTSLARFRAVCKQWNALCDNKRFVNNHFACARARQEFLLQTDSKMYSIRFNLNDDDPNIKVCELDYFHIPGLGSDAHLAVVDCNGHVLLRDTSYNRAAVWNPWLRQIRWINIKAEHGRVLFCGKGYDSSSPERSYKVVGYTHQSLSPRRVIIYEIATNAWKYFDAELTEKFIIKGSLYFNIVSLNGNLYWTANKRGTGQCFIGILDCSKEIVKPFCILPCKKTSHVHFLAVFKGDRFSLLEQCKRTSKIEIRVTKKKITNDGDDVVWIKFMSVSIPNVPMLYDLYRYSSFLVDENIYGKSLVMCGRDETRQACVYIVRGDMCKKIKIDDVVGNIILVAQFMFPV